MIRKFRLLRGEHSVDAFGLSVEEFGALLSGAEHFGPGLLPSGGRVMKVRSEPGDARKDGSTGVLVAFTGPAEDGEDTYIVQWDGGALGFCRAAKLLLMDRN